MARTKYNARKAHHAHKKPGKPVKPKPKPESSSDEDEEPEQDTGLVDPDKAFPDEEDETDTIGQSIWADQMITNSVQALLRSKPDTPLAELAEEFCRWIEKTICRPSKPNGYKRWTATIKRSMLAFDDRQIEAASKFLITWGKTQAKTLAAQKLYEPHQAERFLMRDIIELWIHWLNSHKPVRREAALYSAITFFTGARAIEVGKLHIEDLYFEQQGKALVMPIRESKNNVFKDIPERLTMIFRPECPIDLRELYMAIRGDRTEGRLFQVCKNRRTLCYHYARGAMELGWSRTPSGHSGRTTAITLGIAVGIPKEDLEIMFRWVTGSDMYRRYRSVHMECSEAGAPALVARALVGSLTGGPLGTPSPINRTSLRDANVDLGWYAKTITTIQKGTISSGVPSAIADTPGPSGATPPAEPPRATTTANSPGPSRAKPSTANNTQQGLAAPTTASSPGPSRAEPGTASDTQQGLAARQDRDEDSTIQTQLDFLMGHDLI